MKEDVINYIFEKEVGRSATKVELKRYGKYKKIKTILKYIGWVGWGGEL